MGRCRVLASTVMTPNKPLQRPGRGEVLGRARGDIVLEQVLRARVLKCQWQRERQLSEIGPDGVIFDPGETPGDAAGSAAIDEDGVTGPDQGQSGRAS